MFAFALLPTLNAYRAAQEQGTRLSLAGYFAGLSISTDRQPSTETYLIAENKTLQLDIWQLTDALEGARPAALMVHGGSWASGARSETPRWNSWLNEQGVVVVDIDYRLTPPARWRDATGDVKCAVVWTKRHAARLGIDPTKIVLIGNSAGAHLALLAAYTAGDARLPANCPDADAAPDPPLDTSVVGVIALSPPTDLRWLYDLEFPWWFPEALASTESLEAFTGGTPDTVSEAYRLGSPINHVRQHLPPTLLIHGENDQLVFAEETDRLAARLAAVNAPHRVLKLPGADHLFAFSWGGWGSQLTRPVVADFLTEAFD